MTGELTFRFTVILVCHLPLALVNGQYIEYDHNEQKDSSASTRDYDNDTEIVLQNGFPEDRSFPVIVKYVAIGFAIILILSCCLKACCGYCCQDDQTVFIFNSNDPATVTPQQVVILQQNPHQQQYPPPYGTQPLQYQQWAQPPTYTRY